MIKMIKYFFILMIGLSLLGCAPTIFKYYYISLENTEGIKIVNREKLKLKKLICNSEIPTEYIAYRDKYYISFLIGNKSYSPNLIISVDGIEREDLIIRPKRNIEVVSPRGNICASYHLYQDDPTKMGFGWSTGCLANELKKEITFDVIDRSGNLIASEAIPFILVADGYYIILDAI